MSKLERGDEDVPLKLSMSREEELTDILDELRAEYQASPKVRELAKAYVEQVEASMRKSFLFKYRSEILEEMSGGFKRIDSPTNDVLKPVDRE